MLTVALDAEHTRQSAAGVARYARSLAGELRKLEDISVIELGGGDVVRRGTARKRLLTARQDFLWYPVMGRRSARRRGADVYHSPLPRGPLTRGFPPFVVTVHDLVPLRFPETMTKWSRIHSALTFRRVLEAADLIIAPSQDTAGDLAALAGVAPRKIRIIPNGVDELFFGPAAGKPAIATPYILFVGTPEPRKNLDRLLSAMTILRARGMEQSLVVVGGEGWGPTMKSADFVRRVGRVPDVDLHALYTHASCLALPSLHEGFGLPVLEAMAAGTPVVAANSGALPEVTGDAAVLVDPMSSLEIADGIEKAIAERDSLVARGRARARAFSWKRTAALTAAVYREIT